MFPVSQDYINAIRALSRTDRLTGSITFLDGETLELDEGVIGQGSVSISWRCVESEEIQFGSAPLGQLKMSIRSEESRYKFFGAVISLTYSVLTVNGWFDRPLGIFTVGEADRKGTVVQIVAYDNLILLDADYDDLVMYGRPYSILTTITEHCNVTFGMTEDEIKELPNGNEIIQIDYTSGCSTYRDCLKIMAQMLGCFAVANSDGEIILKQYGKQAVTTYGPNNRYSLSLADYTCQYSGIVIQSSTGKYSAYDPDIEEGLELYIKNAPAWDYGAEATLQTRTEKLLQELVQLVYTPCSISLPGDPAIECGDVLELVKESETYLTIATSITWKFRGKMSIESTGVNPFLKARKTQKSQEIRELEQETTNNRLIFYNFTNEEALSIPSDLAKEIMRVTFVTTEATSAMFLAQIPVTTTVDDDTHTSSIVRDITVKDKDGRATSVFDADGNPLTLTVSDSNTYKTPGKVVLQILYYLNGALVDYELHQALLNGDHILTLFYPFAGLQGKTNSTFSVRMRILSGTGSVDIAKRAIKATITGQGLASTDTWGGAIDVNEMIERQALRATLGMVQYSETVTVEQDEPTPQGVTDYSGRIGVRSALNIGNFVDYCVPGTIVVQQTVHYENNGYTENVNGQTILRSVFDYNSVAGTIDTGSMAVITIRTSDKQAIDGCEVSIDG